MQAKRWIEAADKKRLADHQVKTLDAMAKLSGRASGPAAGGGSRGSRAGSRVSTRDSDPGSSTAGKGCFEWSGKEGSCQRVNCRFADSHILGRPTAGYLEKKGPQKIIPSTVGDIAPLDEGSYCADDALDSAFAQLDVSVQSQDAAVKLQSAVLPVDVPVPQLSSLGVARLSKPLMLAGIEHVLDGLHDWSGFGHTAVPPAQLTAELCEILQMGSHGEPFAAATLSQHLPAWKRWLEMQDGVIPHSETVRCMIWEGVRVHLCAPEAASQRRHPR